MIFKNYVKIYTKVLKILVFILLVSVFVCTYYYLFKFSTTEDFVIRYEERIKSKNIYSVYNKISAKKNGEFDSKITYDFRKLNPTEVTLVTEYFNLGSFKKGELQTYSPALFRNWIQVFKAIHNPVIAYFDTQEMVHLFEKVRKTNFDLSSKTKIILVQRKNLWSFELEKNISKIFSQPGYPTHHPNTVLPSYSCAMHAKYELMKRSIEQNPFQTKYIAWIDVGLFRELVQNTNKVDKFEIVLPPNFNEYMVSYSEVTIRRNHWTPIEVVTNNLYWVCGCFFISRVDTMYRWTAEYIEGVEWLMKMNLMSTDQQLIYILFSKHLVTTKIQTFKAEEFGMKKLNPWFYLGYISRKMIE